MNIFIKIRNWLLSSLVELSKPIYNNIRRVPKKAWGINKLTLSKYPRPSLGYALYEFLERHQLDLMPTYEMHDVMHVLTGYGTTVPEEARMQYFLLGNGRKSASVLFTVLLSTLLMPEYWSIFWKDYRAGKAIPCFVNNDFQQLLDWEPYQAKQPVLLIVYSV